MKSSQFVATTLVALVFMAALVTALVTGSGKAFAGEADVTEVSIQALGNGKFRINTTVKHADTGWDHYADRWDVLDEQGNVIGVRELAHPHVGEQPFTRSLTLTIDPSIKTITVRANDSVHELGGATVSATVPH